MSTTLVRTTIKQTVHAAPGKAGMKHPHVTYRERLRVPLRWWFQGVLLVATFWLAMVVAIPDPLTWSITSAAMVLLAVLLRTYGGARIVVDDGWLHAGRARIDRQFVATAQSLDRTETRAVSGPLADARAHLLLRPYLSRAVRIEIIDPDDPTPYWLISSRRPDALAASLTGTVPQSVAPEHMSDGSLPFAEDAPRMDA